MTDIYRDILQRTGGDIYIAVAGPVRTGKSTFIKRFAEVMLLPGIEDAFAYQRVVDELPQSGAGRTIMTTQPRFVPPQAVEVKLGEEAACRMKLVDCVGYLVPGAEGAMEEGAARMVSTPWFDYDIPFEQAAEVGTDKVIREHSTICLLMTTDGTITDIPRENYLEGEKRAIETAKATEKPLLVAVNSRNPAGEAAQKAAEEIREKYGVPVVTLDAKGMGAGEIQSLLTGILYAFPLKLFHVELPSYLRAMEKSDPLWQSLLSCVQEQGEKVKTVGDFVLLQQSLAEVEKVKSVQPVRIELGKGEAHLNLALEDGVFYEVLSREAGTEIVDDFALVSLLKDCLHARNQWDKLRGALEQAEATGYGVVTPDLKEMELLEPEIFKQGGRYGVTLRARSKGLHCIRVDIRSEVSPMVGSQEQAENLIRQLKEAEQTDPASVWDISFFGKTLLELVREKMELQRGGLSEQAQQRMQSTIERMANQGCSGLICIML